MNNKNMMLANVDTKPSAGIVKFDAKGVSTKTMFLPNHLKPLYNKSEKRDCNDFEQLAYIGRYIVKRNGNIPKSWDKDVVEAAKQCYELERKGQHTDVKFVGDGSKLWSYTTTIGGKQ